jgi:hypothetical protein
MAGAENDVIPVAYVVAMACMCQLPVKCLLLL